MAIWFAQTPEQEAFLEQWALKVLRDAGVFGEDEEFGPAYSIGFLRDEKLIAVAVYHMMRGRNIELSFAATSPRWATKENIAAILAWPFTQTDVARITTFAPRWNKPARKLNEGIGFERVGHIPGLFAPPHKARKKRPALLNHDGLIYAMIYDDWKKSKWADMVRADNRRAA